MHLLFSGKTREEDQGYYVKESVVEAFDDDVVIVDL
jgi:hypothetical protein